MARKPTLIEYPLDLSILWTNFQLRTFISPNKHEYYNSNASKSSLISSFYE